MAKLALLAAAACAVDFAFVCVEVGFVVAVAAVVVAVAVFVAVVVVGAVVAVVVVVVAAVVVVVVVGAAASSMVAVSFAGWLLAALRAANAGSEIASSQGWPRTEVEQPCPPRNGVETQETQSWH